ncbi:hypothetical protein KXD93_21865 [Mucilaginibacter sp. BJC16-A38]|uniref:hypothetical protein n=1 Tax=Mucilaginibacter phenanthrenivorans TaxID=1234842 RepID=UPI0021584279|nr:hypothetical protein [Mucilaginibacter phenanthrenivorans]MCR8560315.1 hypothetical protein [Mucilaginibacter phenanthrenivorans]
MKITDLDGKEIIVTDLLIAILQADDYRHYRVSKPSEYDLYLCKYWEDIYQKLLLLETEIKSGS